MFEKNMYCPKLFERMSSCLIFLGIIFPGKRTMMSQLGVCIKYFSVWYNFSIVWGLSPKLIFQTYFETGHYFQSNVYFCFFYEQFGD